MKFYIASGFNNIEVVKYVSEKLKSKGFIHTYDWTLNERASSLEDLKRIGELEKNAIFEADFVVVLLPAGKGSHIELGMALGQGKKIYLFSPDQEVYDFKSTVTFYHLPEVEKFIGNMDDLVELIILQETF